MSVDVTADDSALSACYAAAAAGIAERDERPLDDELGVLPRHLAAEQDRVAARVPVPKCLPLAERAIAPTIG